MSRKRILILTLILAAAALVLSACSIAGATDFEDVDEEQWYYESVYKVADDKIMSGVAKNVFGPEAATTRAMLATVLWRADGAPGRRRKISPPPFY